MNHFRQGLGRLVLIPAGALFVSLTAAQNITSSVTLPVSARPAIVRPPMPTPLPTPTQPPSPVGYFRNLLAMSPQQLQRALAEKPPKVRARILAKVQEYSVLNPAERDMRLRATELHWYLMPLLQAPPEQRSAQLALVPADVHDLVQSRLMEWEILPAPLQQEFLENEHTAGYFAGLINTNKNPDVPPPSDTEQARWNGYSEPERQTMIAEFNRLVDLSPEEKQKALGKLTGIELKQTEAALQAFAKLPVRQRAQCFRAFGKFENMSWQERAEFLKNAQLWSKMSPSDRQAWRDLVAHVPQWPSLQAAPINPPVPPMIAPPALGPTPQNMRVVAATNHG